MLAVVVEGRNPRRPSVGQYNRMSEAQRADAFKTYQDLVQETENAQQENIRAKSEHERLDKELSRMCQTMKERGWPDHLLHDHVEPPHPQNRPASSSPSPRKNKRGRAAAQSEKRQKPRAEVTPPTAQAGRSGSQRGQRGALSYSIVAADNSGGETTAETAAATAMPPPQMDRTSILAMLTRIDPNDERLFVPNDERRAWGLIPAGLSIMQWRGGTFYSVVSLAALTLPFMPAKDGDQKPHIELKCVPRSGSTTLKGQAVFSSSHKCTQSIFVVMADGGAKTNHQSRSCVRR